MMCSRVVWIFLSCVIHIVSVSCESPGKGERQLDTEDITLCGKDCKHTASLGEALNIEDMDEPTLKNALESTSERGKIALQVWDPRNLKGTPSEYKLDILINAISKEIVATIPGDIKILPQEASLYFNTVYVCLAKGSIRSNSIEQFDKKVEKIENGFKLVITFKFNDLSFEFGSFYMKISKIVGWETSEGEFHLPFFENTVEITLQIPDSSTKIFQKLIMKQCIADIILVKMTKLEFGQDFPETITGEKRGKYADAFAQNVGKSFSDDRNKVEKTFEQRILMQIHKALATQDTWICKDMSKTVSQEKFEPTKDFKKYCKDFDDK